MSKIDEIMSLIRDMEANTPGIEASAVVSIQGLPIASAMPAEVDESVVAAMTAAMLSVGERAAQELARGNLQQITLQGDYGYIIIKGAGMSAIITVLAKSDANLGLIMMVLKKISNRISELLSEE
ncbi:MAG: roadblock/LC7 domain-containing protein [Candidatus Jordarchaeaceae archaeon]